VQSTGSGGSVPGNLEIYRNDFLWACMFKKHPPKKMTGVQSLDLRFFFDFFHPQNYHKFVKVKA
jgi:hypothetical protein